MLEYNEARLKSELLLVVECLRYAASMLLVFSLYPGLSRDG